MKEKKYKEEKKNGGWKSVTEYLSLAPHMMKSWHTLRS